MSSTDNSTVDPPPTVAVEESAAVAVNEAAPSTPVTNDTGVAQGTPVLNTLLSSSNPPSNATPQFASPQQSPVPRGPSRPESRDKYAATANAVAAGAGTALPPRNPALQTVQAAEWAQPRSPASPAELVAPSTAPLHKFKKRDPSPALSRKIYDNGEQPHVPAISASREDVSSRVVTIANSFRRHGSMRADELKDLVYNYAQKYATTPPTSSSLTASERAATLPATPSTQRREDVSATPTRKVTSQWEKDVADEERTTREQETIAEELLRITGEIRHREAVIRDAGLVQGSEEESRLVDDLYRLANEKNGLVNQQEYYNAIENYREAVAKFDELKAALEGGNTDNNYAKTEEEKRRTDEQMAQFMAQVEIKEDMAQRIFAAEEKLRDAEEEDYAAATGSLPRGASLGTPGSSNSNFQRGAPVSASRRIAQGVQKWLQG